MITSATREVLEMGWLLDPAIGEGKLRHPDFPKYRIRFEPDGGLWLDERSRGLLGRPQWSPVHAFPLSEQSAGAQLRSLPKDLQKAAANPDAFLDTVHEER